MKLAQTGGLGDNARGITSMWTPHFLNGIFRPGAAPRTSPSSAVNGSDLSIRTEGTDKLLAAAEGRRNLRLGLASRTCVRYGRCTPRGRARRPSFPVRMFGRRVVARLSELLVEVRAAAAAFEAGPLVG